MRFLSFLLILTTLAGCATTEGGNAADLQTGTFRGRWWDYYERGRTQLDAGNYAAAEEDLRRVQVLGGPAVVLVRPRGADHPVRTVELVVGGVELGARVAERRASTRGACRVGASTTSRSSRTSSC